MVNSGGFCLSLYVGTQARGMEYPSPYWEWHSLQALLQNILFSKFYSTVVILAHGQIFYFYVCYFRFELQIVSTFSAEKAEKGFQKKAHGCSMNGAITV